MDLSTLTTEMPNPRSARLSTMNIREALTLMNEEDKLVLRSIQEQIPAIERLIAKTADALQNGGRIIYMGAGTSGRLALLDALECPPTFGVSPDTFIALLAGGEQSLIAPKEDVEDSEELGKRDLCAVRPSKNDVVIGLAASGRTPYVIGGLKYAKQMGCTTGCIVCNKNSSIAKYADFPIELVCGPEVLTGSTRLKAGTAQKIVLNMISTISMVQIGKVYKNYMVDVQLSNEKLVQRGIDIVSAAANCSKEEAEKTLLLADNKVKTAIMMRLINGSREEAETLLKRSHGRIEEQE